MTAQPPTIIPSNITSRILAALKTQAGSSAPGTIRTEAEELAQTLSDAMSTAGEFGHEDHELLLLELLEGVALATGSRRPMDTSAAFAVRVMFANEDMGNSDRLLAVRHGIEPAANTPTLPMLSYELWCEGINLGARDCPTLPARGEILDFDTFAVEVMQVRRVCVHGKPDVSAVVTSTKCYPLSHGKAVL